MSSPEGSFRRKSQKIIRGGGDTGGVCSNALFILEKITESGFPDGRCYGDA
jgi:hypothetical protein